MDAYIERVISNTKEKNPNEKEFLQSVEEVLTSLEAVIEKHPEYEKEALLERLVEPERVIEFRVAWEDDNGNVNVKDLLFKYDSLEEINKARQGLIVKMTIPPQSHSKGIRF